MKRFSRAIALPLGLSLLLPVATGAWPAILIWVRRPDAILKIPRDTIVSTWRVVAIVDVIVGWGAVGWAGWRARQAGVSAALAGGALHVVTGLFEEVARIYVRGQVSLAWLVFISSFNGALGALVGGIGGLLVSRFHPELRPRPSVPWAKVKHFPNRMTAEMAGEMLEREGIPSGVVEAPGWPAQGAYLYVDEDDALRAREIISVRFGDL